MRLPKHFSSSLVVVILGAVVLSSCGTTATLSSSTTTTKTTQTTTSQPTTSTTTATTSTTSTAPPSTTTTTSTQQSNVATRCRASQLSFSYSKYHVLASEQINVIFRYTNTSSMTCTLYGYPGIEFYTANGQPIIAKTRRGGPYPIGYSPSPHLVTLTPGMSVYFYVGWIIDSNSTTGINQGCAFVASVKSYPPNSYTQLSLTLQPPTNGQPGPIGNTPICNLNTIGIGVTAVATSSTFIAGANNFFNSSSFASSNFLS